MAEEKNLLRRDFNDTLRLRVNDKGKIIHWLEIITLMNIHGIFTIFPGTELSCRPFKIVLAFSKLMVV